jgi:uncharacterized membrane protein
MQNPPPVQSGKSSTGLDENVAALLSYVFGWISGLVFLLIEKDSRLVRFHAVQSIILNVASAVLLIGLEIVSVVVSLVLSQVSGALSFIVGIVFWLVIMVLALAIVAAWVVCLIKAYQGQYFKLPIIGNFAEQFSTPK